MHPNKLHLLRAETPTEKTASMKKDHNVYLSHASGVRDIAIYGNSLSAITSLGPYRIGGLGDVGEDGRAVIPIHCHGENLLGGEELAEAMLALAAKNASVTASLDGHLLTYSSKTTAPLITTPRLRCSIGYLMTFMFKVSSPEATGTALNCGLGFIYPSGGQTVSFDGSVQGATVQVVGTNSSTKSITGLRVNNTGGLPRVMDIRSFGIYRGAVTADVHEPYWGARFYISLRAPLASFSSAKDIVYPLRGYAERNIDCTPVSSLPLETVELGATYPSFRIEIPEHLRADSTIRLSHFTATTNQSTFLSNTYRSMRSEDGTYFYITGSSSYATLEKMAGLLATLGAEIQSVRQTPLYETVETVTLPTKRGRNYFDAETVCPASTIDFTYY
ncbi:MAG: hypothetical protein J6J66_03635 [Clostridia bacterium]|nr:hypothetical protein [Clostridia bacterium]